MYSGLILLIILLVPLPVLAADLRRGEGSFRAVLRAAVFAGAGIALIFVISNAAGHSIIEEARSVTDQMAEQLAANDQFANALGVGDEDQEGRLNAVKAIYEKGIRLLPASFFCIALVVAWLEGKLIGSFLKDRIQPQRRPSRTNEKTDVKDGKKVVKKSYTIPPLRELKLSAGMVIVWIVIVIAAAAVKSGTGTWGIVLGNMESIFQFLFSVAGASFLLFVFHKRNVNTAVPVVIIILAFIIPVGQMILFLIGLVDTCFKLKKRIAGKDNGNKNGRNGDNGKG